jgi:glycosyltransferase involved in cell wall biosynthesis
LSINTANVIQSPRDTDGQPPVLRGVTLICTLFNEAKTITEWCESLLEMAAYPEELLIVDALSTDGTDELIRASLEGTALKFRIIRQACNISAGRNIATEAATTEKIVVCDAGVRFNKDWFEKMAAALDDSDWAGGYYSLCGDSKIQMAYRNLFEVPVDKIDGASFLPSSRSFSYKRSAWRTVGGYDTRLKIAEDTDFVHKLRSAALGYQFVPDAIVRWEVRDSTSAIWLQHFRYAFWDALARQSAWRIKHFMFYVLIAAQFAGAISTGSPWAVAASIAVIWLKPTLNIRRAGFKRLASAREVTLYYLVGLASSIGYGYGIYKRKA